MYLHFQCSVLNECAENSCSIWDPYTHDNINKPEMIQRRAVFGCNTGAWTHDDDLSHSRPAS
jgi:hypothetical protein